jgi:hypothetical protein
MMAYGIATIEHPMTHASIFRVLTEKYNLDDTKITNSVSGFVNMTVGETLGFSGGNIKAIDVYDLKNVSKRYSSALANTLYNAAVCYFMPYIENQHSALDELINTIKSYGLQLSSRDNTLKHTSSEFSNTVRSLSISGKVDSTDTLDACIASCAKILTKYDIKFKSYYRIYLNINNYNLFSGTC